MSKSHPVVAVTGSSGAGTSTVKRAFEHIFAREDIVPAVVEGDSYHRFERLPMKKAMADALAKGENFSHFGPEANLFDKLEELFKVYGETGGGKKGTIFTVLRRLKNIIQDLELTWNLANLHHGKTFLMGLMFYFTKVYMEESWEKVMMSHLMLIS